MSASESRMPGVSGMSLYVPRYRVPLEQWCTWTGATWPKVEAVVGRSFRICGPDENVYTMAANAVLRLIVDYDVDPREVGFLGLGTESSTDNAAGAIIVKGMVDEALERLGKPRLSRDCEVPEFKHACLGGVLGLKAAVRYLRCDGKGRRAIVVCGDLAQYARGSTGEQTQGAGAVAMLVDETAGLFAVDLDHCGGASDYRGIDFRKPFARHFMADYGTGERMRDFPVFNGRYSTHCYVDAVMHAIDAMFDKLGGDGLSILESAAGVFLHRPYHRLPQQAMAAVMVRALARAGGEAFESLCARSGVDSEVARRELLDSPRLFEQVNAHGPNIDPNPAAQQLFRDYGRSPEFQAFTSRTMELGSASVRELGNLYTASLPAWLAAALDDAHHCGRDLANGRLLAVGYGSGDAAEAVPLVVSPSWHDAAARIDLSRSLAGAIDLDREQYEALHDGLVPGGLAANSTGFVIADVGRRNDPDWQDIGIEYYRFVG